MGEQGSAARLPGKAGPRVAFGTPVPGCGLAYWVFASVVKERELVALAADGALGATATFPFSYQDTGRGEIVGRATEKLSAHGGRSLPGFGSPRSVAGCREDATRTAVEPRVTIRSVTDEDPLATNTPSPGFRTLRLPSVTRGIATSTSFREGHTLAERSLTQQLVTMARQAGYFSPRHSYRSLRRATFPSDLATRTKNLAQRLAIPRQRLDTSR